MLHLISYARLVSGSMSQTHVQTLRVAPHPDFDTNCIAERLSLESLDKSRAVGRESLDIPKFGREVLDMGRNILTVLKFGRESLDTLKISNVIPNRAADITWSIQQFSQTRKTERTWEIHSSRWTIFLRVCNNLLNLSEIFFALNLSVIAITS